MSSRHQLNHSKPISFHNKNPIKSKPKDQPSSNQISYQKNYHSIKVSDIVNNQYKTDYTEKNSKNRQKLMYNQILRDDSNKECRNNNNNDNIKKKTKTKQYNNIKRAQTPDPSLQADKAIKYPKPEMILKQIQRNVNVLKQMYFASLSQHGSTSQNKTNAYENQQILSLCKSQQNNHYQHSQQACQSQKHNNSKRSSSIRFNKKSIPQISISSNYNPRNYNSINNKNVHLQQFKNITDKQNNKNSNSSQKEIIQNATKNVKKKKEQKKSRQQSQKNISGKRKSASALQKTTNYHNQDKKQKTQNQKKYQNMYQNEKDKSYDHKDSNVNSLFQIFKFYKRSIDSSLSRQSSKGNIPSMNSNTQKTFIKQHNIYMTHENHNSLNEKSYGKDTPNNSTTKNTTNHKNSTNSRIGVSSIQPSIEVSVQEDPFKNQKNKSNKKNRKNSKSNSATKKQQKIQVHNEKRSFIQRKNSKQKIKNDEEKVKKSIKSTIHKEQIRENAKNYIQQINHKKPRCQLKKSDNKGIIYQEASNQQKINNLKQKQKLFDNKILKKKQTTNQQKLKNKQMIKCQKLTKNRNYNKQDDHEIIDNLQFPQIQQSAFNRNMPILEEDSQQEASSSLIVNTQRDDQTDKQLKQAFKQRQNLLEYPNDKIKLFAKKDQKSICSQQKCQNLKIKHQQYILSNSNKKYIGKVDQNTRFPTPSFVMSEIDEQVKNNEQSPNKYINCQGNNQIIQRKQFCGNQWQKNGEDSLVGCEIPKIQGSSIDLDNFQLVSFEL